jgi:peptidoglycan/LPS O-acetylase OafA/YrhL
VKSANREYLPAVDHLRAAAAVLVVLYHGSQLLRSSTPGPPSFAVQDWAYSTNPVKAVLAEGHSGVALFMVLSGFILTTGQLGRDVHYGRFLRNRLLRVGPLYLVLLVVAAVVSGTQFTLLGVVQTTLGFATLPGGFTAGPFGLILWTVGVELQFYVLFPFFLRLLDRQGPRPLLLLIACMAVLRTLAAASAPGLDLNQLTYYSIVGRIDQFLIGMVAAHLFPKVRRHLTRVWPTLVAAAVVVAALWCFDQAHGYAEPALWRTVWVDVEGVVWAGLILTYVSMRRAGRGRTSVALAWVGERSYGVYLLHMPVIYVLATRGWRLELGHGSVVDAVATAAVLVLPGAVLLASLTFAAIEQPFLSLRGGYAARGPVVVPTTPPPVPLPRDPAVHRRPAVDVHRHARRVTAAAEPISVGGRADPEPTRQ